MSDIPCIAVEHQDRDVSPASARGRADVERGELFVVGGGDHEFFEICYSELGGTWDGVA
jgi:hypothetical protein